MLHLFSSNNVRVERNILQNPESRYELGSHLIEPNTEIDCRHNWIGDKDEKVRSLDSCAYLTPQPSAGGLVKDLWQRRPVQPGKNLLHSLPPVQQHQHWVGFGAAIVWTPVHRQSEQRGENFPEACIFEWNPLMSTWFRLEVMWWELKSSGRRECGRFGATSMSDPPEDWKSLQE